MRKALFVLSERLDRICLALALTMFTAMIVCVGIQVVARYVIQFAPAWTEELARYFMVWGGFLGATVAFRRGVDPVLVRAAGIPAGAARTAARFVRVAAVMVFFLPILYYSLFGPTGTLDRGFLARHLIRTAETLGFPTIWVASAVPVMITVILVHAGAQLAGYEPSDAFGEGENAER